jgi:hypothetical protein
MVEADTNTVVAMVIVVGGMLLIIGAFTILTLGALCEMHAARKDMRTHKAYWNRINAARRKNGYGEK